MSIAEKIQTIAENEQLVYEAGYNNGNIKGLEQGYNAGKQEGIIEGKQAEYDKFWDTHQTNGTKKMYAYAFYGASWNDETFTPKYDIKPVGNSALNSIFANSSITDLKSCLEKQGVTLDVSGATSGMGNPFLWCMTKTIPLMDVRNVTSISFYYAYLCKTIDAIYCKDDGSNTWNWDGCGALIDIYEIRGKIGRDFNISATSKLSVETALVIIDALMDYSNDSANANKYTLKFHDTVWANLDANPIRQPGNNMTWKEWVQSKGWLV